ncbi:MAG: 3-deoxy-D-manno-octulosonic acid transferase [Deltaproteobacteria bacterium]|nr:3-deoxy-D-manno-octulosonic acid transferase [Deltaproteobacteria bacterium]
MLYILYQLFGWLLFIVVFPFACVYLSLSGKHRQGLRQRFGHVEDVQLDENKPVRIWLHASSVGEMQVAKALISEIKKQLPEASIVVSTGHRQGLIMAENQLPDDVPCFFAPLDLIGIVNRTLKTIRPTIYVCLETELWPNIIRQTQHHGAKLFLLNGRLSENSYAGYRKIKGFMSDLLSCFTKIAVIQGGDAKRFRGLGADPANIRILGNAKYDQSITQADPHLAERYRQMLDIHRQQPVLVTGSTHTGEEAMLIEVFRSLQQRLPDLVWVIAPRHLRRLTEIEKIFEDQGIATMRLRQVQEQGRSTEVVLVDTMGELAGLYSIATYVFCGGSLVERGGHNVLEAAAWGMPVFYGPHMGDFSDAQALLEAEGAGFCVKTPQELASRLLYFIEKPEEYAVAGRGALKVASRQQGSAQKQIALIKEDLHSVTQSSCVHSTT